jgi:hypothetical protein
MAGASGGVASQAALKRRQALAGKSGLVSRSVNIHDVIVIESVQQKGLIQNSRVFFIAVFASLGGL